MLMTLWTFVVHLFAGLGPVALYLTFFPPQGVQGETSLTSLYLVLIGLVLGAIWYFVDGYVLSGFLKGKITILSNAFDTRITVKFGDLFEEDGWKVISVNEYFDSVVDGPHVAENSLHGAMLLRSWAGNAHDFDRQIEESLTDVEPLDIVTERRSPGKTKKYEVGTTVTVVAGAQKYLCVALTRTDIKTLQASADLDEYHSTLRSMLKHSRGFCSGQPLNIPLLGGGLARLGVNPRINVNLILLAIFEESKRQKITGEIRVVLDRRHSSQIDLSAIEKDWS